MQDNQPVNLTYDQMSDMVDRIEQIPPLKGEGAPTSDTPAFHLGQTYIDTTTGDMYYCSSIVSESGGLPEYIWEPVDTSTSYTAGTGLSLDGTEFSADTTVLATKTDLAGKQDALTAGTGIDITNNVISATSTGPTVVQTTGTSTADVMSQNAVTSMVYADPATQNNIKIGRGTSSSIGSDAIEIGHDAAATAGGGVAMGHSATASGMYGPTALGNAAQATGARSTAIGNSSTASANASIALGLGATATQQGQFDVSTGNQTTVGYNNSNYRLLTGLYDPQSAHDAATKGYVDGLVGDIEAALHAINYGESS